MFQSTHPHGVRLKRFGGSAMRRNVSIHAPTRGATTQNSITKMGYEFQSTHPHGVRHNCFAAFSPPNGFNPRTHTGCDVVGFSADCL